MPGADMQPNAGRWSSLNSFRADNRGVTALIFGISALALLCAIGAGVETARMVQAKAKLQAAADAAALMAKRREIELKRTKSVSDAQSLASAAARQIFAANIEHLGSLAEGTVQADIKFPNASDVEVIGSGTVNFMFGKLLGQESSTIKTRAVATLGDSVPVEVAMVLDNTASMFATDGRSKTRFTLLRDAAKTFTHKLFDAAQTTNQNFVRLSVIPWATTVNILSEAPAAADSSGGTPVLSIPDYGSRASVSAPIDRSGNIKMKASDFAPVKWRGCIEGATEKIDDYSTNAPGGMKWDALVIQPRPLMKASFEQGKQVVGNVTTCTYSADCYTPPPSGPKPPPTQGFLDLLKRAIPEVNPAIIIGESDASVQQTACTSDCRTTRGMITQCDGRNVKSANYCWQDMANGRWNTYVSADTTCTWQWGCYPPGTPFTTQPMKACVADPNEEDFLKVDRANRWCSFAPVTNWTTFDAISGPNMNCPVPMLGLSGNRRQVLASLDRMYPVPGGTHADVGLRWGLRSLSNEGGWDSFFKLSAKPGDFKTGASKIMMLITDGENTAAADFLGYWGCNSDNPGCSGSVAAKNPSQADLDKHMLKWCDTIRTTYGIRLITVAVNISNPAAVDLLKKCAGGAKDAYSVDAAELEKLLSEIAEGSILSLRLKS